MSSVFKGWQSKSAKALRVWEMSEMGEEFGGTLLYSFKFSYVLF
mgnify:CR=1 FL=1